MSVPPFTAEELQNDEDAEREARVLEWSGLVEAASGIGAVFALVLAVLFGIFLGGML